MPITAVLFDLDETLVMEAASNDAALLATCERARRRFGIDPRSLRDAVRKRARELWHASPTIDYCRDIGISSWEGLWARFTGDAPGLTALRGWASAYRHEAWSRALADHGVHDSAFADELSAAFPPERRARHAPFGDAKAALEELRGAYRLGLLTNGPPDIQHEKLEGAGLRQYFNAVVVSGEVGIGKPDPRIFHLTLERLGASPAEAAMVGDSLARDIVGARRAGLTAVWVNRAGASRGDPAAEAVPDVEIAGLSELRDVLERGGAR
jgi:putative hydrolase of the HAD superfamily